MGRVIILRESAWLREFSNIWLSSFQDITLLVLLHLTAAYLLSPSSFFKQEIRLLTSLTLNFIHLLLMLSLRALAQSFSFELRLAYTAAYQSPFLASPKYNISKWISWLSPKLTISPGCYILVNSNSFLLGTQPQNVRVIFDSFISCNL